ncbi:hypothetical protein BUALT_Bualt01G0049600 [Buddleja alternifolia]|uniref:Uncharacterized protein n=1 Tax=Buddleja alternifolia TaxID=168488 RepID=A0AAV6Y4K4_9LAMI|nr:hypothetical protein BUALT_Bualt01G0049600 [Buddleja alternifolia]
MPLKDSTETKWAVKSIEEIGWAVGQIYICILCLTAAAGTELADAYSPDTIIASYLGKEVQDLWAFYLHTTLLR